MALFAKQADWSCFDLRRGNVRETSFHSVWVVGLSLKPIVIEGQAFWIEAQDVLLNVSFLGEVLLDRTVHDSSLWDRSLA